MCIIYIWILILEIYIFDLKKVSDDIKVEFYELIKEWWGLEVFSFFLIFFNECIVKVY